jgi:hypothetical protein
MKLAPSIFVLTTVTPAGSLALKNEVRHKRSQQEIVYSYDSFPRASHHGGRGDVSTKNDRILFQQLKMSYLRSFYGSSNTMSPTQAPNLTPTVENLPSSKPSTIPSIPPTSTELPSGTPTTLESSAGPTIKSTILQSSLSPATIEQSSSLMAKSCEALFEGSLFEGINEKRVDVDENGFGNLGDVYIWDNNVIRSEVVHGISGFSAGRCVLLEDELASAVEENFYCSVSFYLGEDGGFILQGAFYEPLIGGGIDCFEGMVGLVDCKFIGQEFAYDVTMVHNNSTVNPTECPPNLLTNEWTEPVSGVFYDWKKDIAPSSGDSFILKSSVFDTGTSLDGTVQGECMYLEETSSTDKVFCISTFRITESGDQLVVMGLFNSLTIIAGSGCFLNISGTVQGTDDGQAKRHYSIQMDQPNSSKGPGCIPDIFTNPWTEELGDVYVDYLQNGVEDAGEVYVFDNKVLTIPLVNGTVVTGTLAGRCFVSTANEELFCQYAIEAPGGTIVTQGLFTNMLIVGASGCFQGLNGYLQGDTNPLTLQFVYRWLLVEGAST